ncbi:MAG: mechanosensitive ion channel [Deltaproteobacteria bacterium]|nr:mechanosensitive ion channel [Deltaproteobacteria bacterium]
MTPSAPLAAPGLSPESLPDFLSDSNEELAKEIAFVKEQLHLARQTLSRINKEKEDCLAKIAALNASLALRQLNVNRTETEVASLNKRMAMVSGQIKEFEDRLKILEQKLAQRTESLAVLQKQIASLRQNGHPVAGSKKMRTSYRKYESLVKELKLNGQAYQEILKNILAALQAELEILTATDTYIREEYLGKTLRGELFERQVIQPRLAQLNNILETLAEMPGKARAWAMQTAQSGRLVAFIKQHRDVLIGLLLFLLFLWVWARKVKALVLPGLISWKAKVSELGLTTLLDFIRIFVTRLFSFGLVVWLYVSFLALGILEMEAAWLVFHGLAALVVLRLALRMIQDLFAGEEKGGILPVAGALARHYRRHLKALAVYFFVMGVFILPNAPYLGFTDANASFLRHLFQVVLLAWVFLLLRRRYLDPLLRQLPVPPFFTGAVFLRTIRSAVGLVLALVVVANLLGYRFLSDYVAEGASFILVVAALSWILGEGAYVVLRLTLHPEMGLLTQRYLEQRKFFTRLHRVLTQAAVLVLAAVAVLVALKVWGIPPGRLAWAFRWVTWGPALGPLKLTPLNVGLTVLIIYLGFWLSRLIRTLIEFKFYPHRGWDPGIQYTVSRTVHYVILVITAFIALNVIGISLTSLALVIGGLGVGIGFGLQNIVSNFVSGLILLFERPIKIGDMLVIDGQWGMVKEIRVRSTIFQTFDRYFLIIPNSELLSNKILNWTYSGWGINRLGLKVGVSYDSDPRRVTGIIEEVCKANPRVVKDPPPQVFFQAYGDSSLDFNIWVYLGSPSDRIPATHELNSAIFEAFQANGIEIPFPQRDLHIRSWSPKAPFPPPEAPSKE